MNNTAKFQKLDFPEESDLLNESRLQVFQKWVKKTNFTVKFELLYKGSRDGFYADEFHHRCDK